MMFQKASWLRMWLHHTRFSNPGPPANTYSMSLSWCWCWRCCYPEPQADPQRQAELRKLAQQIKAKASAKAAEEAEQPVPDFAAIEMALKGLAMKLPSQGASSSSSRGSDAELLLSRLLPKQQSQQQQKGRKRGKKQQSPEEAAAVEYERAREHQLGVVQEQLDRNKEQDLGKVGFYALSTGFACRCIR